MEKTLESHLKNVLDEATAEYFVQKITAQFTGQWSKILEELAATRRMVSEVKEDYKQSNLLNRQLEAVINRLQQQIIHNDAVQQREDKILAFLVEEFDVKE